MQLTEQETNVIKDLQTQEKACVDKYRFYEQSAHDEELKNLFHRIGDEEQEHFDSLGMVLKGDVPNVSAARSGMEGYTPSGSYAAGNNSEEKKHDQFLCTDCIATEKLVSSTYNDDVFRFSASNIRRLLNHIQTEEQNHAEMIYKNKTANNMAKPVIVSPRCAYNDTRVPKSRLVHACMIRDWTLVPAKHEKVAIYAINPRISNVCRIAKVVKQRSNPYHCLQFSKAQSPNSFMLA